MISSGPLHVVDNNGVAGTGETTLVDGETRTQVRLADGRVVAVPPGTLEKRADGAYAFPGAFEDLASGGGRASVGGRDEPLVVPVVEEQLRVEKRTEETGGVRVRKVVHEHEETFDQSLLREQVDVERVAVGRMLEEPAETRQEGNTLIIPLMEEVIEVKKRYLLKEEVRITRRSESISVPQSVTVRSEDVVIERFGQNPETQQNGPGVDVLSPAPVSPTAENDKLAG